MNNPNRLRQFRQIHHLSQTKLAELLGVHPITVAKWECGMKEPRNWKQVLLSLETLDRQLEETT